MRCFLGLETTPSAGSAVAGFVPSLILAVTLLADFPVCALDLQQPKYRLQEHTNSHGQVDRQEGIKPLEIAGETLALVAVLLHVPELQDAPAGETYRLGFYLQEAEPRVSIKVRDYNAFPGKYHYWMFPTRTQYAGGFQEFTWDAALAQELGIRLGDFGAVADMGGYGYRVILPLLLHTTPFPARLRAQGCRFIFMPNETMTVTYHLASKSEKAPVFLRKAAETWHKGVKQLIAWDGRDRQSRPAPEGWYVLVLTATFTLPGKPGALIPYDVMFCYKPDIGSQQ